MARLAGTVAPHRPAPGKDRRGAVSISDTVPPMHLATWLGLTDPAGPWYLAWSGFVGDLSEASVLAAAVLWYQHRKCVRCWRVAKHVVEGTAWSTCHRHLTAGDHDALIHRYRLRHPRQFAMLASARADSDKLRQP